MTKYSLNPISEILIQFNLRNIYSVKSLKYLFNPITEIFVQFNHLTIGVHLKFCSFNTLRLCMVGNTFTVVEI